MRLDSHQSEDDLPWLLQHLPAHLPLHPRFLLPRLLQTPPLLLLLPLPLESPPPLLLLLLLLPPLVVVVVIPELSWWGRSLALLLLPL